MTTLITTDSGPKWNPFRTISVIFSKAVLSFFTSLSALIFIIIFCSILPTHAQVHTSSNTMIGAQVYIEPGQTYEEIELYFQTLKEHNMTVCRIRMDETHMRRADGTFDFSLYQKAFDEAQKNGVKVFATLFPGYPLHLQDEYGGVGGFKFPVSDEHLQSIAHYVAELVKHFKDHPALYVWVLQNEPGVAGNMPDNDFAREKFREWLSEKEEQYPYNGFMQVHTHREDFMRDYTTWYLGWLGQQVRQLDIETPLHLNPHMIFRNLADYDFPAWREFVAHIGASMHPSWHFGYFSRNEFPLAMAANGEIMRTGSLPNPWWVTELQGGYNSFSAFNPINPTKQEIAQWLWTNIAKGTEGIIFWTLNPRAAGLEAGEWALIDFQHNPSDRLTMAGEIAGLLKNNPDLAKPQPLLSEVHLLYSPESLVFQRNAEMGSPEINFRYTARTEAAHVKEMLAFYRTLEAAGTGAQIWHIHHFDWEADPTGKTIILANMTKIPRTFYPKMERFVQRGGKIIASGLTGHLDEFGFNVMFGQWPLADLFGATIREFNTMPNRFPLHVSNVPLIGHFMQGIINTNNAEVLGINENGHPIATKHSFGKGEVVWIPSIIGIAEWEDPDPNFSKFLRKHIDHGMQKDLPEAQDNLPGLTITHFKGNSGNYSLIINKTGQTSVLSAKNAIDNFEILFSLNEPQLTREGIILSDDECLVIKWR